MQAERLKQIQKNIRENWGKVKPFNRIPKNFFNCYMFAICCTMPTEILLSSGTYISTINDNEIIIICNNTYKCILRIYAGLCVGKRVILLDPNNRLEDIKDIIEFCDTNKVFISEKEKAFKEQLSKYDLSFFEEEILDDTCEDYKDGEAVFYTSGTSNKSKGIILTGENIINRCSRSS